MAEEEIGKITHYFSKISVAVIKMDAKLSVGDVIHIKGASSDFQQKIDSMQMNHEEIEEAKKGEEIAIKVNEHVREHDIVYKVIE